jgi:histidine triad (HIT) family protein
VGPAGDGRHAAGRVDPVQLRQREVRGQVDLAGLRLDGERRVHGDVQIGYFAQHTVESLREGASPIDHLRDIAPQAPVHVLFVPKRRFDTLNDVPDSEAQLLGGLILAAKAYAKSIGIADDGYRVVMNCNRNGGQTVFHIHMHLLGGAPLTGGFA